MATTPGIVYICDFHGQGGNPGMNSNGAPIQAGSQVLVSDAQKLNDRAAHRFVPDVAATGEPNGDTISCWPWYDANGMAGSNFTVASSTTTTITVSPSPGWTTNQWAGRKCTILTQDGFFNGLGFTNRIPVVSNTADTITFAALGSAPTVGAKFFLGAGRFTDYHVVSGQLSATEAFAGKTSSRSGSSYSAGGVGIGPDATLLRRLLEDVYPAAPYFHFWKYANATPIRTGWADAPNNSERAIFLTEKARVDAAAAERGNTISWQVAILDMSMTDLTSVTGDPAQILLYRARLEQMIAWLRSSEFSNNPNLKIVLVTHRQDMWGATLPAVAAYLRGEHRATVYFGSNIAIADMEGQPIAFSGEPRNAEAKYYTVDAYLKMGHLMADTIVRMGLSVPATPSGAMPVYLLLGDSIAMGQVTGAWVDDSSSIEISGPNPDNIIRPANQMVWNRLNQVVETYKPADNSNTSGSLNLLAGPELALCAELGKLHPDGFVLIKRASAGSALAIQAAPYGVDGISGGRWMKSVLGEHYGELQEDFAGCTRYINQTLGKQVDVRGAFVVLGANDGQTVGGGAAFTAGIKTFCDDLWADFSTRTSGRKFPILWRRPQVDAAGMIAAEINAVREALAVQANRESQFRVVDVDGLERDRADNLHETPETAITHGRRSIRELSKVAL